MTELLRTLLLLTALVAAGLQAGTYYTWAIGVMPGLVRSDDSTFVTAMTHMNRAIVNPLFIASFLGTPLLAAGVAVCAPQARSAAVIGTALAVATLVITFARNIPLNNALDAIDAAAAADVLGAARRDFEAAWVRWNILRALTSTGALAALAWAAPRA